MNKCKPKYKHKNSHKRQTLAYLVSVYECAHIIRVFERMCSFDLIEIYKNLTVSRVLSHLNFMRWVCKCVPVHFRRLRVHRRCGFTIILVFFCFFFNFEFIAFNCELEWFFAVATFFIAVYANTHKYTYIRCMCYIFINAFVFLLLFLFCRCYLHFQCKLFFVLVLLFKRIY